MKQIKPLKLTSNIIEILIADKYNYRTNLIVPNVSWGLGLPYEADLIILKPSNIAIEIEIKISALDIKKDLSKRHNHDSNLFKQIYFAVPESLKDNPYIPEYAGIFSISFVKKWGSYIVDLYREAKLNKNYKKWDNEKRLKLCHLAAMRIWKLKKHLINNKNDSQNFLIKS
jgi:hypothetical protein